MSLINPASDLTPQDLDGLLFVGTVEANNDPLKLERVKVRVDQLHKGTPVDGLPWAIPVRGRSQGMNGTCGTFGVPVVGSRVYIYFQNGDPYFPIYEGSVVDSSTKLLLAETNYPNRWGFVDSRNNHFYSDTQTGDVEFKHYSGTTIHIYPDGAVDVITKGNLSANVTGTTTVVSSGNTTVTTPNATINGNTSINGTLTVSQVITGSGGMAISGGSGASITGAMAVTGNISATGTIMDAGGNSNHHTHP